MFLLVNMRESTRNEHEQWHMEQIDKIIDGCVELAIVPKRRYCMCVNYQGYQYELQRVPICTSFHI